MITATELLKIATPKKWIDEINNFTAEQIDERLKEYAENGKLSTAFYGVISPELSRVYEQGGFQIVIYDLKNRQPMTEFRWG